MTKLYISANYDYIQGHIRYGHKELEVEKEFWDSLSADEQKDYFLDNGDVVIDDYEINDYGDLNELEVEEMKDV